MLVFGTGGAIRKQDPLKQGLKQNNGYGCLSIEAIRKQDPLKQGLKPHCIKQDKLGLYDSKARSTKTRIETLLGLP